MLYFFLKQSASEQFQRLREFIRQFNHHPAFKRRLKTLRHIIEADAIRQSPHHACQSHLNGIEVHSCGNQQKCHNQSAKPQFVMEEQISSDGEHYQQKDV